LLAKPKHLALSVCLGSALLLVCHRRDLKREYFTGRVVAVEIAAAAENPPQASRL
jgi:hypothetical protein